MVDWLEVAVRLVAGGALLTAGLAKWRLGPSAFAMAIEGYRLLPRNLPLPAARAIILAEIAAGAALIAGAALPLAAPFAAALLMAFASAMSLSLMRGIDAGCGCSAFVRQHRIAWRLVYRNIALSAGLLPLVPGSRGLSLDVAFGLTPPASSIESFATPFALIATALVLAHLSTIVRRRWPEPNTVGGSTR